MMFWSTTFVFIACRGIGKTYLSAIYCVVRAILYPGTRICIASGTRGQGINILEKIHQELKPLSAELKSEINEKESKINGTNALIVFNNTSVIKVVTAGDSARGNSNYMKDIKSGQKWTTEELDILQREVLSKNYREIAEMLGRSYRSVQLKASRMKVKRPKIHTQDNSYFNNIDSPDKAYWVGFITADGYVNNSPKGGTYELGIELAIKDKQHLEKFVKCIRSNACISERIKPSQKYGDNKYSNESRECQVRIYSKEIVDALSKYNIINNKTYLLTFPSNIPEEYMWDYIRGYFDGDGCIRQNQRKLASGLIGEYVNISFVCKIKNYLENLKSYFDKFGIQSYIAEDREYFVLWIRRQDSAKTFCDNIYRNPDCLKLERKYQKYLQYYKNIKLPA